MRAIPGASRPTSSSATSGAGPPRTSRSSFRPLESKDGWDVIALPYFKNGRNFRAPQTDIATVWDSYQNVVHMLREKDLTQGVTITSKYKDLQGESY